MTDTREVWIQTERKRCADICRFVIMRERGELNSLQHTAGANSHAGSMAMAARDVAQEILEAIEEGE